MARHSNKSLSKILKVPTPSSSSDISTRLPATIPSTRNDSFVDTVLERNITLITEGFTSHKFCELILKDRNRLSKENAIIICEYVIAMKREVNPQ